MEPFDHDASLRDYVDVIRRRWWIIAATVGITTAVALVLSVTQTPIYEAEAQMLVATRTTDTLFDNGVDLRGADVTRALQTEIRVLEGERVRSRVQSGLGLAGNPASVKGSVVGSTDVIAVRVRSQDPATAQTLANAYVQAYGDDRREQAVAELLAASAQVQNTITELQGQIDQLAEDDVQRAQLVAQQSTFQQTLNQLQVDTALKTGGSSVVKSAQLPVDPVEPRPLRSAAMAAIVGLLMGLGAAFAIDYFDDSVRTENDLERFTDLSALAVVPIDPPPDLRPVSLSAPNDPAVEVYRGLRANIQFLALDREMKVVQVTSSLPGEGKTTTATNLAVVLAQSGRRVAVVDGDLRRPRIHDVFSVPGAPGVVDLLVGETLDLVAHDLSIGGGISLTAVPSGVVPTNPSEMLSSQRMRDVLAQLSERFDHVIVDSAPVLPVSDSIALAGMVDAVLFVTQARRTSRRDAAEALERLGRVNAPVIGFVLNQAKKLDSTGKYGYSYGGYGSSSSSPAPESADDHVPVSLH